MKLLENVHLEKKSSAEIMGYVSKMDQSMFYIKLRGKFIV